MGSRQQGLDFVKMMIQPSRGKRKCSYLIWFDIPSTNFSLKFNIFKIRITELRDHLCRDHPVLFWCGILNCLELNFIISYLSTDTVLKTGLFNTQDKISPFSPCILNFASFYSCSYNLNALFEIFSYIPDVGLLAWGNAACSLREMRK